MNLKNRMPIIKNPCNVCAKRHGCEMNALFVEDCLNYRRTFFEREKGTNGDDGKPPCCTHDCEGCIWNDEETEVE